MTDAETSPSDSPASGLLGSISSALSTFDADATPVAEPRPGPGSAREPDHSEPPTDGPSDAAQTAVDPAVSPWGSSSAPAERPIDASAGQLAQRLLAATNTHPASASTSRFMIVDIDSGKAQPIGSRMVIGRAGNDQGTDDHLDSGHMVVDLAVVSRRHCELVRRGDSVVVHDLGAANGTFLRRGDDVVRIGADPVELRDGDVIATADGHRAIAEFHVMDNGAGS